MTGSLPSSSGPADQANPAGRTSASTLVDGLIRAHDLAAGRVAVEVQIERALRRAGVERLIIRPGDSVDPERHRTVDIQDDAAARPGQSGAAAPGTVVREVRAGWLVGSRVLRAADVVVWAGGV